MDIVRNNKMKFVVMSFDKGTDFPNMQLPEKHSSLPWTAKEQSGTKVSDPDQGGREFLLQREDFTL